MSSSPYLGARQHVLAARLDVDLAREAARAGDLERAAGFCDRAFEALTLTLPLVDGTALLRGNPDRSDKER